MTSTFLDRSTTTPVDVPASSGLGWAAAGLAAGVAGLVGIGASMSIDAVYRPENAGDAAAIQATLADQSTQILVFHTATMVSVVTLLVFAAGLRRQMTARLGGDSLLPPVAASGLLLVSVAGLLGTGLTTEFVFGASEPDLMVPEVVAFFGHWVGTIPWLWVGAGIAALAVGLASVRHGAFPRWLGWVSLVLGALTTLFGVSPLQYMAGMVGPVWLTVAAAGLLLGRRDS